MAIKVYGSNICPGTMRFLSILTENGVMPQFINVTGSINLLKDFIYLRDTHRRSMPSAARTHRFPTRPA